MGIKGIFKYLDEHSEVTQLVDLVEIAQREDGIQLLIDATGFEIIMLEQFQSGLCEAAYKENPNGLKANHYHISALGGEYALMQNFISRFIRILNDVKIDLVWYFDAGKGSTASTMDYRLSTFVERRSRRITQVKNINRAYSIGRDEVAQMMLPHNSRYWNDEITPRLFKQAYLSLLRKLYDQDQPESISGSIIQCVFGEADKQMAIDFFESNRNASSKRLKPYAVVSSNCDFALLKHCRLIPFRSMFVQQWFDLKNDLDLRTAEPFAKVHDRLKRLVCRVVEAENLRNHFQLRDYMQVSDFAFVCGSTFSYDLLDTGRDIKNTNKIDAFMFGNSLPERAGFIRSHGDLLNVPIIQRKIKAESAAGSSNSCNLRMRDSIIRCRQYFDLKKNSREHIEESEALHNTEMTLLSSMVRDCHYASELMAIYQRVFWKTVNQEDLSFKEHTTTISEMLLPLRKIIYRIILSKGTTNTAVVVEYAFDPATGKINKKPVCAAQDGEYDGIESLPHFTKIIPEKLRENLDYYETILRFIPYLRLTPKYFNLQDQKHGFKSHLLRYFLTLNFEENLKVTDWQFLALCYSVLACKTGKHADVDIEWYAKLTTIPDVRCLTMMEWIQELYWHIGYLLATLFFLDKYFPQPRVLFSGSLFSAFYLCSCAIRQPEYRSRIVRYNEVSSRIMDDQKKIHHKYYKIIRAIVNSDFEVPVSV